MLNNIDGSVSQIEQTDGSDVKGPRSPVYWGFIAGTSMLLLYTGVLSIANSPAHAFEQFMYMWYWILPLITGFSLQVGLFVYMRNRMIEVKASGASSGSIAASGGMSATAMVACCVHHLTDLLPVLGLSVAAIFVTRFQGVFLLLGAVSTALGIIYMLKVIQTNGLAPEGKGTMSFILKLNMRKAFVVAAVLGVISLVISVLRHI